MIHPAGVPSVRPRVSSPAERQAITRAALEHLPPAGGSIILDAGSTMALLADRLPSDHRLLVYTNALAAGQYLALNPAIELWMLGGTIRPGTLAAVGPSVATQLASVNADVVFVATNGISITRGLTTPDSAEAAVKAAMVRAGRRRIVLADHSKIGQILSHRHAGLNDIDLLITDSGAQQSDISQLRRAGVMVEIAE